MATDDEAARESGEQVRDCGVAAQRGGQAVEEANMEGIDRIAEKVQELSVAGIYVYDMVTYNCEKSSSG